MLDNDKKDLIDTIIIESKKVGPFMSITAGMHGDEISGVQAVKKAQEYVAPLSGKIQLIPILNPRAYANKTRFFIEENEEVDLNHIMPGSDKTLAHKQAKTIVQILSESDYHIDIHSARVGQINYPHVRVDTYHKPSLKLALSQSFPIVHWPPTQTTLRSVLNKKGIGAITVEAGEGLQIQFQDELKQLIKDCVSLKTKRPQPQIYTARMWILAKQKDICLITPGEKVRKNQRISEKGIMAPHDGIIIGIYLNPDVKTRLIHLAYNE